MLALCLGLFVWNKIRWKNFNCLLFYTKVYRPVKHVGGVALSQQCHDVYNTVITLSRIVATFERRCSTDVQTEFSSTSLRYWNAEACWQDKVFLIYTIIIATFCATNKKWPKRKLMLLYTSVYVCDNGCLGTILWASTCILNYSERVVERKREGAVFLSCSQWLDRWHWMSASKGALCSRFSSCLISFRLPRPKTATSQIEDTGTYYPYSFPTMPRVLFKNMFKDEGDKANGLMFSANDTIVCN